MNTNNNNRIVYLSGDITEANIKDINKQLLTIIYQDEEDDSQKKNFSPQPIKFFINSFGGSVYDAWSLIDIMLRSKTPIHTYCTGYAMSAGFLIFLAGHQRFATPNCTMMYHQITAGGRDKYLDLIQNLEEYTRIQDDIEKYVFDMTSISMDTLREIKDKKVDWYIHSEDFEKFGIAELLSYSVKETCEK